MSSCDDQHEHKAQADRPAHNFGASADKRPALTGNRDLQRAQSSVSINGLRAFAYAKPMTYERALVILQALRSA